MDERQASGFKAVLIDLNGTFHIEDTAIPGAIDALKRLRETNLKIKFLTNTTFESRRCLHQRLTDLGFEIELDEIFTCLNATRTLVEQKNLRPFLFLNPEAFEDFEGINTENPNAVVVAFDEKGFNYDKLNKAFRLILDGALLVATHVGRYLKKKDGLTLAPGAFVKALEYSSGTKAVVVGKPAKPIFLTAIQDMDCLPEECFMIGDDVMDDIEGGQNAGMSGILVKTGVYRKGDENKVNPKPHHVVEDFSGAVDLIISTLKK